MTTKPLIVLFIVFASLRVAHAQGPQCAEIFTSRNITELVGYLKQGQWSHAESVLAQESISAIEQMRRLSDKEKNSLRYQWAGIESGDVISTPVKTLAEASSHLPFRPGQTIIDIGSGHGVPGLVFGMMNPGLNVIGYDFVQAKVDGANKAAKNAGLGKVRFIQQDLSAPDFRLPMADYFYLYNPANKAVIEKMAAQIKEMSRGRDVKVVIHQYDWTPIIFLKHGFRPVEKIAEHTTVYQYSRETPQILNSFAMIKHVVGLYLRRDISHAGFLRSIGEIRSQDRIAYLRSISKSELLQHLDVLDALFGLETADLRLDSRLSSPWPSLFKTIETMDADFGQKVASLDEARFGFLLGLLRPDLKFSGLMSSSENAQTLDQAAALNGFASIRFKFLNLRAKPMFPVSAQHVYIGAVAAAEARGIDLAARFAGPSLNDPYRMYIPGDIATAEYLDTNFMKVSRGAVAVYESRILSMGNKSITEILSKVR